MTYISESYEKAAQILSKAFTKRNMKFYYCPTIEEAKGQVLSLIPENSSVSWGGSESMEEAGIIQAVKEGPYQAIDENLQRPRKNPEPFTEKSSAAIIFLQAPMLSLKNGELVNIDGRSQPCSLYQPWPRQCDHPGKHG